MKVALVQLNSSSDPEENLIQVKEYFAEASKQKANLIAFPENFFAMAVTAKQIAAIDWPYYISELQILCQKYQMACVAGSLPLANKDETEKRPYASCLYIDEEGEILGQYNKIHLFDADVDDDKGAYRESTYYCPGDKPLIIETDFALMGLSICFDLRFSKLFNYYKSQHIEILFVPAAFTAHTGELHWEVLLRARAIENQCFVVAPNQCGIHDDGRKTWGHSTVISPQGDVLVDMQKQLGVVVCELNIEEVHSAKRSIPLIEKPFYK